MTYTLDTPLGKLLDDPQAKKVMEEYVPGLAGNPMVMMLKGVTIKAILAMPQAKQFGLTEEKAQELLDEVNKRAG